MSIAKSLWQWTSIMSLIKWTSFFAYRNDLSFRCRVRVVSAVGVTNEHINRPVEWKKKTQPTMK